MRTDQASEIKVLPSTDPAVIYNSNGTKTGATIDAAGYESLVFVVQSGVLTDGTLATLIYGSNDSGMSGEVALTTTTGLTAADLAFAITDDSLTKRQGVEVNKAGYRYFRMKITQAAATTGGYFCASAILSKPRFAPISQP